jgi:hypothetical protein
MDPHSFTLILQSLKPGTSLATCVGYGQLPVMQPTRLLLIGDDRAHVDVKRLRDTLELEFSRLTPTGTSLCPGRGGLPCWATTTSGVRNILLVIAADGPPTGDIERVVDDCLHRGFETFGVFQAGLDPNVVVPQALRSQLALTWRDDVREVAGEIIDIAVLGIEDRRIFISYSRTDGDATAERLAQILTRLRFDVFLDQFRIPPGADLFERISDELIDKAMVVVVETPWSVVAPWVSYEILMAMAYRLGLAAVNLVGVSPIPGIDERVRCRDDDDKVLAQFLLEQHRNQMSDKRQNLMQSMWRSLTREVGRGSVHPLPDGFQVKAPSTPAEYRIAVQTRPAGLHRFRLAHDRAGAARAVIVHPQPLRIDRRHDLAWLSQTSGVVEVDEGDLDEAARRIGKGRL